MKLHSCYSLKYGYLAPKSCRVGVKASYSDFLADINLQELKLSFVKEAQKRGIKPVVGVELRNDMEIKATLIARNNSGFYRDQ